ncbi:sialidase family protein [Catellatospora methionotrophica]|nr:sialidase family protein [Catellatospora methionotrophica]
MIRSAPHRPFRRRARAAVAVLGVAALTVVGLAVPAGAATTGPTEPATAASVTGIGTAAWSTPANALETDDLYTFAGLNSSTSNYLKVTGFALAVPAGATVNGVSVAIERRASGSSGDLRDVSVKLVKGGTITGTEHADTATSWPISDATAMYGSASDLWGTTLTQADVTSATFGAVLAVQNLNGNGTFAKVDAVTISVTYTPSGASAPVNTTAPAVSGTAQQGQTLTTSTGVWTNGPTYTYQWQRCDSAGASCANISGATASSYVLAGVDVGGRLRSRVTATNGAGANTASSAVTAVVTASGSGGATPPTAPGTIVSATGIGTVAWTGPADARTPNDVWAYAALAGSTSNYLKLTNFGLAVPSGATVSGVTVAVERRASGSAGDLRDASIKLVKAGTIVGTEHAATGVTWPTSDAVAVYGSASDLWGTTLTQADVVNSGFGVVLAVQNVDSDGAFAKVDAVTVTVTYTTGGGGPTPPVNTSAPTISGTPNQGATQTAANGTWTGSPTSYAYRWQRCDSAGGSCVDISGATASTYTASAADVGGRLKVKVTATNATGSTTASSGATAVITSAPAPASYTATGYTRAVVANPAGAPYTSFVGEWVNPADGSIWISWIQSAGAKGSGAPAWVQSRLGSGYLADKDAWNATTTLQYMRSTDHGATWNYVYPHSGVDDLVVTPLDGALTATSTAGCTSSGATSGSGCPTAYAVPFTPQAGIQLDDGTLIRRVNGEDFQYDLGVQATAFLQKLAPGATAWSAPQYLLSPATYTYQISRIRRLTDGRLIAIGQRWDAPAGSRVKSTPAHHLIMVSADDGATWSQALTVAAGTTAPYVNEWDVAELDSGDLIAVFRTAGSAGLPEQALLVKSGSGWVMTDVSDTPFGHSGHPELLRTSQGAILYIGSSATDGGYAKGTWYLTMAQAQAGSSSWTLLPFTSPTTTTDCAAAGGSTYNCYARYYPRSIQDGGNGKIIVVSHNGGDDDYPPTPDSTSSCRPSP